jgi:hypothetical protein
MAQAAAGSQALQPASIASACVEAAPARLAVAFVAADTDLLAFADTATLLVDADIHRRLLAAGADVLDFLDIVGQCQQICYGLRS